jgi:hypothetical protein
MNVINMIKPGCYKNWAESEEIDEYHGGDKY